MCFLKRLSLHYINYFKIFLQLDSITCTIFHIINHYSIAALQNYSTYNYYHMFENANKNIANKINVDEGYEIDFSTISSLSDYVINGKYPFKSIIENAPFNKMSAMLEFKYSEQNEINREFPYISQT